MIENRQEFMAKPHVIEITITLCPTVKGNRKYCLDCLKLSLNSLEQYVVMNMCYSVPNYPESTHQS